MLKRDKFRIYKRKNAINVALPTILHVMGAGPEVLPGLTLL